MASSGFRLVGPTSATDMGTPYAHSRTKLLWVAAAIVGACYGVFLVVTAVRLPTGAELTGQFTLQPAVKALTAVLLAVAALTHPVSRLRPCCSPRPVTSCSRCRGGSRRSCWGWPPS
jgi:hypothetical protein